MSAVTTVAAIEQRPAWRGWIHFGASLAALPIIVALLAGARGPAAHVGVAVYGFGLVAAFGTSATYHRFAWSERARLVLRRMDHSTIFLLIAGTYTPLCLVALPPAWGIPLLCIVWSVAVVGMLLKQFAFDKYRGLQHALYPVLGWAAVIALPALVHSLDAAELSLLVAGGLIYTAGIPVLFRRHPDPWPSTFGYHEVWHVHTVVASACHLVMVALVVR